MTAEDVVQALAEHRESRNCPITRHCPTCIKIVATALRSASTAERKLAEADAVIHDYAADEKDWKLSHADWKRLQNEALDRALAPPPSPEEKGGMSGALHCLNCGCHWYSTGPAGHCPDCGSDEFEPELEEAGWLKRQCEAASREVDEWAAWMRREAHMEGSPPPSPEEKGG